MFLSRKERSHSIYFKTRSREAMQLPENMTENALMERIF